jgi:putative SOS response-associated peptidase YedK
VDAFYEWKKLPDQATPGSKKIPKQPTAIRMNDKRPFALAGLFSVWKGEEGEERPSFTIITTEANRLMSSIHHRMPVILEPKDYEQWLDRENKDTEQLKKLLKPHPDAGMVTYPVSTVVNNSRNDVPECLDPLPDEAGAP